MHISLAARAAFASVLVFTLFELRAQAQATFIEPLTPSELQVTVAGVPVTGGIRVWTIENFGHGPVPTGADVAEVVRRCKEVAALHPNTQVFPPSPAAFNLQFTVNSPPAGAAAAISAIESYFESILASSHATGPVEITVNFAPLGPTTLMSTGSTAYLLGYTSLVPLIIANSDGDDVLYPVLPATTLPVQFNFGGATTNSTDFYITAGTIVGTIPNVTGATGPHATITINSSFSWDYDPTNGIGAGLMCFRTSFAHEIGHALGFNSAADDASPTNPHLFDFLRFQRTANNPTGFTDWKNRARLVDLNTPNDDHELSFVHAHYPMEDGNPLQASHFRSEVPAVGLMDPSLNAGETFHPNYLLTSDLRVLDFLGFDWDDPAFIPTASYRYDVEPNGTKAEASPDLNMSAGSTIIGTTTGSTTTAGSTALASWDVHRVKTAPLPLGIYRHTLTLTSTTGGHTATIRGLAQSNGVISTTDVQFQAAAPVSGNQTNTWYGFGKQEELYYAVTGGGSSTAVYSATLSTSTVNPTNIAGTFVAGPITVTATGSFPTNDTELYVYDSNLNPVPLGHNDDPLPGGAPATITVSLAPGTYYVASSNFNTSNNQSDAHPNEAQDDDPVLDHGNIVVNNQSGTSGSIGFSVTDGGFLGGVSATHSNPFEVAWGRFTVAAGTPPNDLCANAVLIGTGTTNGTLLGATNDGTASCDPGGAASKTVWYRHTNTSGGARLLTATTCGSAGVNDTVLSIYNACGGTQLACNDTCGGSPCTGPSACISGLLMNNGQTVWIRVSDKGLGMSTGNFALNLSHTVPTPSNDSCTTPIAINGFGTFPIDNTGATTGSQGQTETICNFFGGTAVRQDTWFTWTPTSSGTVTVTTCGLIGSGPSEDSKIAVYAGAGCPTGPAIACNDDAVPACGSGGANPQFNASVSFAAVCGTTYTFQMGMYQAETLTMLGSFSVSGAGPACPTPTTSLCKGDGTQGPCPCANTSTLLGSGCGSPFYSGAGATLSSAGIASIAADTLVLTASNIPGPCLFIQTNTGTPVNFGDGILCSTTVITRMGVVFAAGGTAAYPGGTTPAPIHTAGGAANGQTKLYQCWYRSNPAMCGAVNLYNLTQALQLTWGP